MALFSFYRSEMSLVTFRMFALSRLYRHPAEKAMRFTLNCAFNFSVALESFKMECTVGEGISALDQGSAPQSRILPPREEGWTKKTKVKAGSLSLLGCLNKTRQIFL